MRLVNRGYHPLHANFVGPLNKTSFYASLFDTYQTLYRVFIAVLRNLFAISIVVPLMENATEGKSKKEHAPVWDKRYNEKVSYRTIDFLLWCLSSPAGHVPYTAGCFSWC